MENEVKEAIPKYNWISPEEYLEMETLSDQKHEYHRGKVFLMAGASPAHNDIAYNINRIAAAGLHGKGSKLYGSDFRLYIPRQSFFTYPDFSIVCGPAQTSPVYKDNLANPTIIIEILSKPTSDYDRGSKFSFYRSIESLKEYLLVDSLSVSAEVYSRDPHNSWLLTEYKDISDIVRLASIGLSLQMIDVYDDVRMSE